MNAHTSKSFDVVTVGHVLMDLRFTVSHFAGPDEEAVIEDQSRGVGGSAANVAIGVRRLGGTSAVIAKVGLDGFGRTAVDHLMREGVDISGIRIGIGPTGFTVVIIDKEGRIALYGFKGVAEDLRPDDVDVRVIERGRYVHIASLRPDTSLKVAARARELGKYVSWDPGRVLCRKGLHALRSLIKLVDIVFVNAEECLTLTKASSIEKGASKIKSLGPEVVVVKMGAEGVYVLSEDLSERFEAFRVPKVKDATGAGDAFAAGLLTAMTRGWDLKEAVRYGLAVAAIKVTKLGSSAIPTHKEVMNLLKST